MVQWNDTQANRLIDQAARDGLVVTGALRRLVDHFGYVDDEAIAPLAKAFSRSKAEIYGVIQYYTDFRDKPPGQHVLRLCQAESCQAVGARELTKAVCEHTGLGLGETSKDKNLTLEAVYCLGLCANGPAAELDGQPLAELDSAQITEILRTVQS
ncbi:MAG: NAD(P)H-dependent oxidoreductase subunit E [Robiginitomaculum sp.]|nr:NAD(P)H-dependent oxidoreductase subunit E [Robiginitomaculum sp.]